MLFYLLRAAEGGLECSFVCLRAAESRPSLECSFIFYAPQRAGRRWNALLSFARRREKAVVGMLFYLFKAAVFCPPEPPPPVAVGPRGAPQYLNEGRRRPLPWDRGGRPEYLNLGRRRPWPWGRGGVRSHHDYYY